MSQKSDDSVEQFFRKAVVQQDKTFMERDWHSMEKMLDAHDAVLTTQRGATVRRGIKTTALSLAIASLFFVGSESNFIESESRNAPEFVQMQAAVGMVGPHREVKTENPTADLHSLSTPKNEKGTTVDKESSSRKIAVTAERTAQLTKTKRERDEGAFDKRDVISSSATPSQPDRTDVSLKPGEERNADEDKSISDHAAEVAALSVDEATSSTKVNSTLRQQTQIAENPVAQVTSDSVPQIVQQEAIESAEEKIEKEVDEKEESVLSAPRIIITGLISPDFSTTSLTKYSKPSGVFGLLLGYRVSRRFTIMAGVTKSLKKYEGYGNEYSPPEGYWQNRTNGVVPDEVQGQCGIIEVPLMLQFDLVQRLKSRIFVSAGVSSYFMRSENYQYTFSQPNPGAADSWTAKEPTQYLFKIGHLSAGYDRMLTRNLSVGIEPFLKVPFEGIGWTDINLYSTGAYINLRYTILRTHQ
jgi:hypothetical protein